MEDGGRSMQARTKGKGLAVPLAEAQGRQQEFQDRLRHTGQFDFYVHETICENDLILSIHLNICLNIIPRRHTS